MNDELCNKRANLACNEQTMQRYIVLIQFDGQTITLLFNYDSYDRACVVICISSQTNEIWIKCLFLFDGILWNTTIDGIHWNSNKIQRMTAEQRKKNWKITIKRKDNKTNERQQSHQLPMIIRRR